MNIFGWCKYKARSTSRLGRCSALECINLDQPVSFTSLAESLEVANISSYVFRVDDFVEASINARGRHYDFFTFVLPHSVLAWDFFYLAILTRVRNGEGPRQLPLMKHATR